MTYNKPEVVTLDSAVTAIQGTGKPGTMYFDAIYQEPRLSSTVHAYEADE